MKIYRIEYPGALLSYNAEWGRWQLCKLIQALGREDMARDFVRYYMPEKRDRIYESLELLFQGLNTDKTGELFYVFVKYLLSATDVNPAEVEKRVKHLPKGEETVRTTAEVLRKEGYDKGYDKGVVLGEQHGKLENAQKMLTDIAGEQYGLLPSILEAKIKSIKSITTLKNLARQVVKLNRMENFERRVNKAVDH